MGLAAVRPATHCDSINTDISDLLRIVACGLPVDADHYPGLPTRHADIERFCIRHSALHFAKTAGQLAAMAEATDHGRDFDRVQIARIAASSLVNSLKLANEIGLTGAEISELVVLKLSR